MYSHILSSIYHMILRYTLMHTFLCAHFYVAAGGGSFNWPQPILQVLLSARVHETKHFNVKRYCSLYSVSSIFYTTCFASLSMAMSDLRMRCANPTMVVAVWRRVYCDTTDRIHLVELTDETDHHTNIEDKTSNRNAVAIHKIPNSIVIQNKACFEIIRTLPLGAGSREMATVFREKNRLPFVRDCHVGALGYPTVMGIINRVVSR